jgi:hypothetical protein
MSNGEIIDAEDKLIAMILISSQVFTTGGKLLVGKDEDGESHVLGSQLKEGLLVTHTNPPLAINKKKGYLQWPAIRGRESEMVRWNPVVDTCDITKVRLLRLNGADLSLGASTTTPSRWRCGIRRSIRCCWSTWRLSLANVLNDLNAPMPNYRFQYRLQKALEFCAELRSMGRRFLSLRERKDVLALELLKSMHENSMHRLVMEVRKLQAEEANKTIATSCFLSWVALICPIRSRPTPPMLQSSCPPPKLTNEGDMVITPMEKNETDESKYARDCSLEVARNRDL